MARLRKCLLLILSFLLLCISPVSAKEIRVTLDGAPLSCRMAPVIENDRLLVPMRDLMEPLGYTVTWEQSSRSITAKKGTTLLYMTTDASTATVNETPVVLDAPVRIIEDIAFVPLRFVAEYSGAAVYWRESAATVEILQNTETPYQISDSVVMLQTNRFQGSGVILSADGLIATNYHVIEGASMIQVIFDDCSVYQGKTTVAGLDPQADIALLKIEKTGLSPVKTAASFTTGEAVTTVSSPTGKRNTQTSGYLEQYNQDILSFTAPISQGSSGGGLFNAQGQWIGLCSSSSANLYFAIPAAKLWAVPRTQSLLIQDMKNYTYTPSAPRNITVSTSANTAKISWEPAYGADYYRVYCASSADGPFLKMNNPSTGDDHWLWGFPTSFTMTSSSMQPLYCKIETMQDGKSCGISQAVRLF